VKAIASNPGYLKNLTYKFRKLRCDLCQSSFRLNIGKQLKKLRGSIKKALKETYEDFVCC